MTTEKGGAADEEGSPVAAEDTPESVGRPMSPRGTSSPAKEADPNKPDKGEDEEEGQDRKQHLLLEHFVHEAPP